MAVQSGTIAASPDGWQADCAWGLMVLAHMSLWSLLPKDASLLCQTVQLLTQAPHDVVLTSGGSHSEDASFSVQTGFFWSSCDTGTWFLLTMLWVFFNESKEVSWINQSVFFLRERHHLLVKANIDNIALQIGFVNFWDLWGCPAVTAGLSCAGFSYAML